jgi:hypothetical protein
MNQKIRVLIALAIILVLAGAIIGIDTLRGKRIAEQIDASLQPGDIPVYRNGDLRAAFSPADIENLPTVSFVDAEEGKTQEGWLLKDVLLVSIKESQFNHDTLIMVSSSSRNKSIELTWQEVVNEDNMVMFDLSGRGTLKLVSLLDGFSTRDEWVQDVDRIEIETR